jgi:hypothetical protein
MLNRNIDSKLMISIPMALVFIALTLAILGGRSKDVLPSEQVAVKAAEAILVEKYGEGILAERPFRARREGDVWIIDGALLCAKGSICKGGTAHIELSQKDGNVRVVTHGK